MDCQLFCGVRWNGLWVIVWFHLLYVWSSGCIVSCRWRFFLVTVDVMSDRSGFACRVKCVWSLSVRYVFTSETVFSAWVWASGLVVSCEIAKFGPDWRITEVRFESHLTSGLDQVIHETSHWEYINHFRTLSYSRSLNKTQSHGPVHELFAFNSHRFFSKTKKRVNWHELLSICLKKQDLKKNEKKNSAFFKSAFVGVSLST